MIPIVAIGTWKYMQKQAGDFSYVWWLAPGSWIGIFIGRQVFQMVSSFELKVLFGLFLIVVAIIRFRSIKGDTASEGSNAATGKA